MPCVNYTTWVPEDHHACFTWDWNGVSDCCVWHAEYFRYQKPMRLSLSNKPELVELGERWEKESRKAKRLGKQQEKLLK